VTANLRVPLRSGVTGAVRALRGSEEAEFGAAEDRASEPWVSRVLTAVATVGSEPPALDVARALTVGDRNALILGAIVATYGPTISWTYDCPSCGQALDAEVNLGDLLAAGTRQAPSAGLPVPAFRLPTGADLESLAGIADPETARGELLARCVAEAGALSPEAVAAVEQAMAAADALADITLTARCAECQADVSVPLDPVSELSARLAAPPELLADVHALALSYGWTEPDVLALPRPRRREYLALCADAP
jgi:hypothetical protein